MIFYILKKLNKNKIDKNFKNSHLWKKPDNNIDLFTLSTIFFFKFFYSFKKKKYKIKKNKVSRSNYELY